MTFSFIFRNGDNMVLFHVDQKIQFRSIFINLFHMCK